MQMVNALERFLGGGRAAVGEDGSRAADSQAVDLVSPGEAVEAQTRAGGVHVEEVGRTWGYVEGGADGTQ